MIEATNNPLPTISAMTPSNPIPSWIVRTPLPSKIIIGNANGKVAKTPKMAPLFIDNELPNANKLNNKRLDKNIIKNIFGASLMLIPFKIEKTDPIPAIGTPINKTNVKTLAKTNL